MSLLRVPQRLIRYLRTAPKKYYIYGGIALAVVLYGVAFLIPRQVAFSFAGQTCQKQLTVLPGLQKSDDASYDVSFNDTLKIGSIALASTKTCFESKVAPKQTSTLVGVAPFNGPIARTLYSISVGTTPAPQLRSVNPEIPVSKALRVKMSAQDRIHQYSLVTANKAVGCQSKEDAIECDIPSLGLAQGESYEYTVVRSYKKSKQEPVGSGSFKTLRAVTISEGSVTPGQTVYSRPTTLTFTADKPIKAAKAELRLDGKAVAFDQRIDGNALILTLKSELPREKNYELVIKSAEAKDGSTLVEPYKVPFTTSGGPKVASVSVGASGVGQSAAITLTFDQALSKTKDILPFVTFSGGQASIQKRSDTQVVVQLRSLPLCQPFAIAVKQGIVSEHDLASSQNWKFDSRTTCYQTINYGTSLKGRALYAYIFGSSGPITMYVGGIHGNEPSSTSLMRGWLSELESNPARIAGRRIVVVPAINPDGLAANTRTNSRGVNLNRNFPTDNWVKSIKDTDGTHASGGGETPLSEPEASALATLTANYRPRLLLSFHAVGSLAIGDPGGYSASYASRYASMVGYRDGTNTTSSNFDYNVTGGYEDWTYRNIGIPSLVIELSSYTAVSYTAHYKALWAMLD